MTLPNGNDQQQRTAALETVFQNFGDGILVLTTNLHIVFANDWVEKRHSGGGRLAGLPCHEAMFGRQAPCPGCPSQRAVDTGKSQVQVVRIATGPDRYQWFELTAYPMRSESGEITGVIEQMRDVTRLRQTEERLREESDLRRALVEGSRDGIVALDPQGTVVEANQQFADMLGSSMVEVRESHVWDWDQDWRKERVLDMLSQAEIAKDVFEMSFHPKGAQSMHVEVAATGVATGGRRLAYWACRDVTEKKNLQALVRELRISDPVTGVFNRRHMFERLAETAAEYLRGGSDFCLSIMDLDDFRRINEVHGPKPADLVLEAFAHQIRATVRPYDLIGRFGGDEFIVVSRNTSLIETEAMVRRVLSTTREKDFVFEGSRMRLTFSCGLACSGEFPTDEFSIEAMIARANHHLGQAKVAGGDRCVSSLTASEPQPA
jgi:diguanylate cyclase (GGDEF)-like protein/PAS domain S-box-containing protein